MKEARKSDWRDNQTSAEAFQVVAPVIRSAVGVVRETVGLLRNLAALGLVLVSEAKDVEPRQPSILAPNIFSFPTTRPTTRTK